MVPVKRPRAVSSDYFVVDSDGEGGQEQGTQPRPPPSPKVSLDGSPVQEAQGWSTVYPPCAAPPEEVVETKPIVMQGKEELLRAQLASETRRLSEFRAQPAATPLPSAPSEKIHVVIQMILQAELSSDILGRLLGELKSLLADIVRLEAQVARFASVDSSSAPRLSSHHLASIDALQANFDAVRHAITDAATRTSVAPRGVDDSSAHQSVRQAQWPAQSATARDQSQSNREVQDHRSPQLETVPREHAHVTSDSRYASLSDPSDQFMANRAHSLSLTRLRSSDSHPSDTRRSTLPPHRPFSPLREQYPNSYNVPRHSYDDRNDAPAAQEYSSRVAASVRPTSVHEQSWVPRHDSRSERSDGNFASVPHSLDDSINTQRSDERYRRGQVHDFVGAATASASTRAQSHYAANASVFLEGKGKQGKYRVPGSAPR